MPTRPAAQRSTTRRAPTRRAGKATASRPMRRRVRPVRARPMRLRRRPRSTSRGRVRPLMVQPSDRWRPMKRVAGVPWREQDNSGLGTPGAEATASAAAEPGRVLVDFEEMEGEPADHGQDLVGEDDERKERPIGDSD